MTRNPPRRAWRRWQFASALNVAIIPLVLTVAPPAIVSTPLLTFGHPLAPGAHAPHPGAPSPPGSVLTTTTPTSGPTTAQALSPIPHLAVGVERCTFIDDTRSVDDYSTSPATVRSRHRTLLTEIRYPIAANAHSGEETPNGAPLTRHGGYPVIVFAHGYDVTPDTYAALLDEWTRAGYVVVAPFFPDEKSSAVAAQHGANTEGDLANEPGDLAFVTRRVLQASRVATPGCPLVHGLVNGAHIALAGHSDGANAVATLAYDTGLDPQGVPYSRLDAGLSVQAIVILSGQEEAARNYAAGPRPVPLLVVQSRDDQCNSPTSAVTLYRDIHQSDKWFLELQSAHHLPPYDGVDKAAFRVVVATTVRFLAISLHLARLPTSAIALADQSPSIARMYHDAQGPSLAHLPVFTGVCGMN
ncbi:MAG: hypothetical protein HIU57_01300 [Acidobacteria bacterium]|nr:hypothetical protein [Acidobacteriota bacterium]